ncbi:MAG: peroxiredoxin [Candidatus Hodarchaeales archaeon]|jgi:peroxiredoxin Q/BCP
MSLKIGDLAPEFETISQSDERVSSKGNKGKKYVLYFYPRDNTPGCIKEACSIRDNYQTFLDNDILVYGVSGGNAQSHQKFIDKFNLPFPLLMDEKYDLAKKFGAHKLGNRVARITYLINEEGIIEGIFGTERQEKVKVAEHSSQIIQFWKL